MTFQIQARLGDQFEDLYVKADNAADAIVQAKKVATLRGRWVRFVIA